MLILSGGKIVERNYDLEKRKYVIGGAVIVIVLIFLIRLLSLQIMSEDYKKNADSNAFLKKIQYPSRGVIYDRNDKLLVYNQAAYDITVIMKEITELDTMDLCQTLKISSEFLRKKFRDMKDRRLNPGYSPYTNQVFLTQLSAEDCGVFQEKMFKFPGFYIQRRTIDNIPTMPELTSWEILPKFPNPIWKRMNTIFPATLSVN